jgi:hypothetical protein
MKKLIYLLLPILLISCIKYEQPTQPTLSGTYFIDEVSISENDTITSYSVGDSLSIGDSNFPLDTLTVGITKMGFTYSEVMFNSYLDQYETIRWEDTFFYDTRNYEYHGDGFIVIDINGKLYIFDIVSDKLTSLVIKSSNNCFGNRTITLKLSRV